jgi:hypothetical protein
MSGRCASCSKNWAFQDGLCRLCLKNAVQPMDPFLEKLAKAEQVPVNQASPMLFGMVDSQEHEEQMPPPSAEVLQPYYRIENALEWAGSDAELECFNRFLPMGEWVMLDWEMRDALVNGLNYPGTDDRCFTATFARLLTPAQLDEYEAERNLIDRNVDQDIRKLHIKLFSEQERTGPHPSVHATERLRRVEAAIPARKKRTVVSGVQKYIDAGCTMGSSPYPCQCRFCRLDRSIRSRTEHGP